MRTEKQPERHLRSLLSGGPISRGLLAALLGGGLLACQGPDGSADYPGLPAGYQDGQTYEQPSEDRSVEEFLSQLIRSSQIIDGYRVVELDLFNEAEESLSFAYAVEWLDRAGNGVSDLEGGWTPLVLGPGEKASIEFRAPSPKADSWRLMAAAIQR